MSKLKLYIFLLYLISHESTAQEKNPEYHLKINGVFLHKKTKTEFPEKFETYSRSEVVTDNRRQWNIRCSYKSSRDTTGNTVFSIFLNHRGVGSEGAFREPYENSIKEMASLFPNDIIQQYPVYFEYEGYKLTGYSAINPQRPTARLTLFQCGPWLYKILIVSDSLDQSSLGNLEKNILNFWRPSALVKKFPLYKSSICMFSNAYDKDDLLYSSTKASALAKLKWTKDNVDSLERLAGFPDLYLQVHIEGLKQFVAFEKQNPNVQGKPETRKYLKQLNEIIDSGYSAEFLMEVYNRIMIVPQGMILDHAGFEKWKLIHTVPTFETEPFFVPMFTR